MNAAALAKEMLRSAGRVKLAKLKRHPRELASRSDAPGEPTERATTPLDAKILRAERAPCQRSRVVRVDVRRRLLASDPSPRLAWAEVASPRALR